MNFLKNGLSIDEFKISILVLVLLVGFTFIVYYSYTTGDMTDNWLDLIKTLIYVIGGVNAVNGVSKIIDNVQSAKGKTKKNSDFSDRL